jgi:diphosphomevalonate decarboxylase
MEIMTSHWKSPSNIAIVKYWGKKGPQLPANPSVSFTLDNVFTQMKLELIQGKSQPHNIGLDFSFEGKPRPDFEPKIRSLLEKAAEKMTWINGDVTLRISSSNNFPHGAGIASSASSMSALALCLCDIHLQLFPKAFDFWKEAGYWARIGSGSACRSVFGGFVMWGQHPDIPDSSDEYPTVIQEVHPVFKDIRDLVLLIDEGEKSVSSSKGHNRLEHHPYSQARFSQGFDHTAQLVTALKEGDKDTFMRISRIEALTLHAMMMTGNPGYFLLKPNTLQVLNLIDAQANKTGLPLFYTMDAGPNVHMLYFKDDEPEIMKWVNKNLLDFCVNKSYICNGLGTGPTKIRT